VLALAFDHLHQIYGDAFFVMKQVDVNKVLLLDFTMKDFENLLVSVLKVRNNVSIPITRPDFFEQVRNGLLQLGALNSGKVAQPQEASTASRQSDVCVCACVRA
jgi:hypothetical protein